MPKCVSYPRVSRNPGSGNPFERKYLRAILHHGRTVGDADDSAPPLLQTQVAEQSLLGIGIQGTRCLIEQEHAARAQQCPGYGYPLSLPLT